MKLILNFYFFHEVETNLNFFNFFNCISFELNLEKKIHVTILDAEQVRTFFASVCDAYHTS